MLRSSPIPVSIFSAISAMLLATLLVVSTARADQSGPPPQGDAPRTGNRQQWEVCRKQADAQQLSRGEARREFMRNCIKSAQAAPAQPASS
jgi:hypothetical protein